MKKTVLLLLLMILGSYAHASALDSVVMAKDCYSPTNLTASLEGGRFQLTWSPVEGAAYYEMYLTYTYWNNYVLGATLTDTTYQGNLYWPWAENSYYVVAHCDDNSECISDTVYIGPETLDFFVTDLQGNEIHLYEILDGGQYVFLDFFHYTCGPCRELMPYVEESYYYFGCNKKDVFYLEISGYDDDARCQQWCEEFAVEYPTISKDRGGALLHDAFRIPGDPFFLLIAPNRSIVLSSWRNLDIENTQSIITAFTPFGIQHHQCNLQSGEVEAQTVSLYPNPADDFVSLDVEVPAQICIYNNMGQFVESFFCQDNQLRLATSHYKNGLYLVKADGQALGRFVVNHR